jgi:hypothetical protein
MKNLKTAVALMAFGAGLAAAQEFRVTHAEYGHDNRWADVTEMVRRAARGGRLDLVVGNQTFGMDPAPAEVKSLRIEYVFNGQPMREEVPENTRLLLPRGGGGYGGPSAAPVYPDGGGGQLRILSAQYGSNRRRVDVGRQVSAFVRGGELRMRINNDTMGGDPDKGADKQLRIDYEFNGQRDSVTVGEDNDLVLPRPGIGMNTPPPPPPPAYGGRVVIISAGYGARDRFVDVARILRSRIGRDGFLRMPVNNDTMGGDPFRGPDKVLRVDYEYQGQRLHKDVREGDTLVLP